MFKQGSIQSHLNLRDKIFAVDPILFFCILILGIISFLQCIQPMAENLHIIPKVTY